MLIKTNVFGNEREVLRFDRPADEHFHALRGGTLRVYRGPGDVFQRILDS
jgi:hypothetical protein